MKDKRKSQLIKISIISSLYLFLFLVYIAWINSPAKSYELSIYYAFPTYFWGILSISIFLVLSSVILSIHLQSYRYVWFGVFSLFLLYSILLLMPVIRDYVLYGRGSADILVHIGHARSILETGHFHESNYYPVLHILLVSLNQIGISLEMGSTVLWTFFSFFFIIFTYLLADKISTNRKEGLFILFFSFPLYFYNFHLAIHPALFSFMMIPLILYLFHSAQQRNNFYLLIVIMSLLIVFFHPMTTLILILILIIFKIYKKILTQAYFTDSLGLDINKGFLVLIFSYITWIFTFERGIEKVETIILWPFREEAATTVAEHHMGLLPIADIGLYETFSLFVNRLGVTALYLSFPLLIVLYYVFIKKDLKLLNSVQKSYTLQYFVGLIFLGYSLIGYLIEFNPIRNSRYAVFFSVILLGLFFYKLYRKKDDEAKYFVILIVFLIVLSSSFLCVFNMYGSPRNTDANKQLSHTEHRGLNWHLNTRNESIELHAVGLDLRKYEIYFYGRHDYRNHLGEYSEDPISTRFGYEENETVYDSLGGRGYMITNDFNRVSYLRFPEEVHDQTLRYLEEDFERIEEDPTANKIYQNGGQEVWMIEK